MRGTLVLTPNGERRIEDLRIGDSVATGTGDAKPIEWIGRRRFVRAHSERWIEGFRPIRIATNALGPGVPYRDLFVSREHCLFLDGILIPAANLVNGSSISVDAVTEYDEIEYLHIKLAAHDIVFAHGTLSETLRIQDSVTIERFENFIEYERLGGSKARVAEVPCARVVSVRGGRDKLRSRVRSTLSPWLDYRNTFDKVRDRLEERADAIA
jgi:hypothetical protein